MVLINIYVLLWWCNFKICVHVFHLFESRARKCILRSSACIMQIILLRAIIQKLFHLALSNLVCGYTWRILTSSSNLGLGLQIIGQWRPLQAQILGFLHFLGQFWTKEGHMISMIIHIMYIYVLYKHEKYKHGWPLNLRQNGLFALKIRFDV